MIDQTEHDIDNDKKLSKQTFTELKQLVKDVRNLEKALGSEKKVNINENPIREWAFRSIVSLRDIEPGETIVQEMIWSKRPGTGIPSFRMEELIGKSVKNKIKKNTLISWEDLN